jgi:hypothetical protein
MAEESDTPEVPIAIPQGDVPAIYADSFTLSIRSDRLRISFGEYLDGKVYYRTAVSIPLSDANSLSKDIAELLERQRSKPLE